MGLGMSRKINSKELAHWISFIQRNMRDMLKRHEMDMNCILWMSNKLMQ